MKYKIIKLDRNNKVTFTKEELETLLNDVYEDGRKDGYSALFFPTTPEKIELTSDDTVATDTPDIVGQVDWDNVFAMQTPVVEE